MLYKFTMKLIFVWFNWGVFRCICGGMDHSTEKDLNLWGVPNQRACWGFLAIVVLQGAETTLITRDQSLWKTLEHFKRITKGSMGSNLSCAGNAGRLLRWGGIGGLMRRTVASSGTASAAPISSTRDLLKTILKLLEVAMQLMESMVSKKKTSQLLK